MRFLARRWKWLLVLLLLAVAATGLWWWRQPPGLRVAGKFPVSDSILIPRPQGFLIQEGPGIFTMRDWQAGNIVWRISAKASSFSLSPDGHIFALLIRDRGRAQVRVWQDGRLHGKTALPFSIIAHNEKDAFYAGGVQALDGGRVLCWRTVDDGAPIVAVEGGKIIARGRIPNRYAGYAYQYMSWQRMASDGKMLVGDSMDELLLLARIAINNSQIAVTPYMNYAVFGARYIVFPGEVLVMEDGKVITPKGITYDNLWTLHYNTPVGNHLLQYNRHADQFRVLTPASGRSWQYATVRKYNKINSPDGYYIAIYEVVRNNNNGISPDGGHVAIYSHIPGRPPAYPRAVNGVLRRLPDALRLRAERTRPSQYFLSLYRKPGRLVARQWLDENNRLPETGDNCRQAYPAPDGRTVAVLASRGKQNRVLLLKVAKW